MEEVVKIIMGKGIKGVCTVLLIISFIAIFISPSFIFIYLYKSELISINKIYTTALIVLIADAILFVTLLILSSIIPPYLYKNKHPGKVIYGDESVKMFYSSVVIALGLMALISIVQTIFYYFRCVTVFGENSNLSYGIGVLVITIIFIIVPLINLWDKVRMDKKDKLEEIERLLEDD